MATTSALTLPQRQRVVQWLQEGGQSGSLVACVGGFMEDGLAISDELVLNRLPVDKRTRAYEPVPQTSPVAGSLWPDPNRFA